MNTIYNKYPWIVLLTIVFISTVSIGAIYYSFNLGQKMTAKYSILLDATMEAKLNLTTSHLWLEEAISGDETIDFNQVVMYTEETRWYLNAILKGDSNQEGSFQPIDLDETLMRTNVQEALALLDKYQKASKLRYSANNVQAVGSDADQRFDELFTVLILTIDRVKSKLQAIITEHLQQYVLIRDLLVLTILGINLFLLFLYRVIVQIEKKRLQQYADIESKKLELQGDITKEKRYHKELEHLNHELVVAKKLIDHHIPMSKTDFDGTITHVNDAMCSLTGYSLKELVGKKHSILRHADQGVKQYDELWNEITQCKIWNGELQNRHKNGTKFWTKLHIQPLHNNVGEKIGYQALREDITNRKKLEVLASYDKLTGIHNRTKFDVLIEHEMDRFKRYGESFSLAIFDLDHFKQVNDTYGHLAGDDVLVKCANVMKGSIRTSDILARWGGEEFVLLLPHTNSEEAVGVVDKIRQKIENISFGSVGKVTTSCGVSQVKADETLNVLFKRVDDALYEVKKNGRNHVIQL